MDDEDDDDDKNSVEKRAIHAALMREKQLKEAETIVEKALAVDNRWSLAAQFLHNYLENRKLLNDRHLPNDTMICSLILLV